MSSITRNYEKRKGAIYPFPPPLLDKGNLLPKNSVQFRIINWVYLLRPKPLYFRQLKLLKTAGQPWDPGLGFTYKECTLTG